MSLDVERNNSINSRKHDRRISGWFLLGKKMTRARSLTNADSFWFADDEIFQINHQANEMHVCTEFDKRWRYLLSSMGNSLVIVATGDLKVAKDREETYIRAKDRGRFDRSNTVPPRGSFLFPLPKPRISPFPRVPACRTCVRIRFHAIPFDRVLRINYFRTDPPFSLLVSRGADVLRRKKEDN